MRILTLLAIISAALAYDAADFEVVLQPGKCRFENLTFVITHEVNFTGHGHAVRISLKVRVSVHKIARLRLLILGRQEERHLPRYWTPLP